MSCKGKFHDEMSSSPIPLRRYCKDQTKSDISETEIKMVIRRGIYSEDNLSKLGRSRLLHFCENCLKHALAPEDPHDVAEKLKTIMEVAETLASVKINETGNQETLGRIMKLLAQTQTQALFLESKTLIEEVWTNKDLRDRSSAFSFLLDGGRNKVLLQAFLGFCNVNLEDLHGDVTFQSKKMECLSIAFSHILKCRNLLTVTLPCLRKNFTAVQMTYSKKLLSLCGLPAGGSYPTSRKLLQENLPPCPYPLNGDFGSHIDNTQMKDLKAFGRLQLNSKFNMQVKSSNIMFQSKHNINTSVLCSPYNLPKAWRRPVNQEIIEMMIHTNQVFEVEAEKCRNILAEKFLKEVLDEGIYGEQSIIFLQNNHLKKFPCRLCGAVIDLNLSQFCSCGHSPVVTQSGHNPYASVPPGEKNPLRVFINDTEDFNPSGKAGAHGVEEQLRKSNVARPNKERKEKISVGLANVDCRIYIDLMKMIESRKYCLQCELEYDVEADKTHEDHKTEPAYGENVYTLGWGHLKFLIDTTFVQSTSEVYMAKFSKEKLGFRTKNAQASFFRGKNHRKTHQAVCIATEGFMKELFRLYISEVSGPYNITSFNLWVESRLQSPQAFWAYSMHFTYGLSLMVFQSAVRQNNIAVAKGALYKIKSLLFATKHPLYKAALLHELVLSTQMPPELQDLVDKYRVGQRYKLQLKRETNNGDYPVLSKVLEESRVHHTHQAVDLLGEEAIRLVNNCTEQHCGQGIEVFQRGARRAAFYGEEFLIHRVEDSSARRYPNLEREVVAFRQMIRFSGFLDGFGRADKPFLSVDGKTEINSELHNIRSLGESIFDDCVQQLLSGEQFTQLSSDNVPITQKECTKKTSLGHKTKSQIIDYLKQVVKEALLTFKEDPFLKETLAELENKTEKSYKTKLILEKFAFSVLNYIKDLNIEKDIFLNNDSSDDDSESENDLDF